MVCAPLRFCFVCGRQPCTTCHTLTFPLFFRTNVRDSQMFKIPTPPANHVSRNRMSRNFQKEAHTDYLRGLPEGTAEPLIGPTRQAAAPTIGAVQLPKVT